MDIAVIGRRVDRLECGGIDLRTHGHAGTEKNELKPHLRKCWVIPPQQNAEFVARMEDVLNAYQRAYDPKCPVVCLDEQPTQLVGETRRPIPVEVGQPQRYDYEYERLGSTVNFMVIEPLGDWRKVNVRATKTAIDLAEEIKELLDVDYPDAQKVVLVRDNLNTHTPASLYIAFEPAEARRLLDRLAIHYTPKHGSWLDVAEIELSVFTKMLRYQISSQREIYSVSRLNREVRLRLTSSFPLLWVEGEISNLARPSSGHLYFTLKDAEAQVRCAMFKNHHLLLDMTPEHGMQVRVHARVGLYEKRGDYQLTVEHMEEVGSGVLQQTFEVLKQKLAAEGLFDSSRKKPLPAFPKRLGVITSPSGAAIRDILSVLQRRYPVLSILIYPVPVQGEGAAEAIAQAVREADRRKECDVLIISRGGGSIEDLWAFNEEVVARAIANCELPLVSGVGHEIDFTIADFVADQRAPTPSAAASLISPNRDELLSTLTQLSQNLHRFMQRRLDSLQQNVQWLQGRLHQQHPQQRLQQSSQRLDELERRLQYTINLKINMLSNQLNELRRLLAQQSPAVSIAQVETLRSQLEARLLSVIHRRLEDRSRRLQLLARALNTVSPLSTLSRGYAIVTRQHDQAIVRTRQHVSIGGKVHIRLARDRLSAEITGSEPLLEPDSGENLP